MKKIMLISTMLMSGAHFAQAQDSKTTAPVNEEISAKNSWLKIGLNAGLPIGDASDLSSFSAGLDLRGQFMTTPHFGLGIASGYNHYFGKDPFSDFGTIPVELMVRYYHKPQGFFAGLNAGYSFFTNVTGSTGGFTIKPELGYHNYNWNFFGYYNHIFTSGTGFDIQSVGIGAAYNIRFK